MKTRTGPEEALRCSFCHKSQDAVAKLISSPSDYPRAYICDECVAVCNSILEDDRGDQAARHRPPGRAEAKQHRDRRADRGGQEGIVAVEHAAGHPHRHQHHGRRQQRHDRRRRQDQQHRDPAGHRCQRQPAAGV